MTLDYFISINVYSLTKKRSQTVALKMRDRKTQDQEYESHAFCIQTSNKLDEGLIPD